jgi:hypothetical protein
MLLVDMMLVGLFYSSFRVAKCCLVRFLAIAKLLRDLSFLPKFQIAKKKKKQSFFKMDVLRLVLKALNFKDKISIRRGECNTPIKVTFLFRRSPFI